jgi:hypothetical protein
MVRSSKKAMTRRASGLGDLRNVVLGRLRAVGGSWVVVVRRKLDVDVLPLQGNLDATGIVQWPWRFGKREGVGRLAVEGSRLGPAEISIARVGHYLTLRPT